MPDGKGVEGIYPPLAKSDFLFKHLKESILAVKQGGIEGEIIVNAAARSLGKNAYWYKMQALMIGGVFGAMGGMLRAIGTQSAQPQNFITDVTFFAWVALILGGAAKVLGPIAGAAILYAILSFTDVALRQGVDNGHIPEWLMTGTQVGQVRFMLIGLGLILLAAFRPQGIFGNKEEMALDDR